MALGYDGKLFILAFDHRGSFQKKMFGIEGDPTAEESATIADAKHLIYEGLELATKSGADASVTGALVDEQRGGDDREQHDQGHQATDRQTRARVTGVPGAQPAHLLEAGAAAWGGEPVADAPDGMRRFSVDLRLRVGGPDSGLVTFRKAGGAAGTQLVPVLAVAVPRPTDGGRTYRFVLRRGIRYSNGKPVRPADVTRPIGSRALPNGDSRTRFARLIGPTCGFFRSFAETVRQGRARRSCRPWRIGRQS